MYKVFISNRPVIITRRSSRAINFRSGSLHFHCSEKEDLRRIIGYLESDEQISMVHIYNQQPERLYYYLTELYEVIEAAGGLVQNAKGEWLLIHRRGSWDLPKGKIDPGESREQAAVREVAEECGIAPPEITEALPATYHTYQLKDGTPVLKPTYWFKMRSEDTTPLVPQTEEDIEQALWAADEEVVALAEAAYPNIRELLSAAGVIGDQATD